MKRIKNEEWFYVMLDQDLSYPRDIFFDYRIELEKRQKEIKHEFKKLLKMNINQFHMKLTKSDFHRVILESPISQMISMLNYSNSFDFICSYLYSKFIHR